MKKGFTLIECLVVLAIIGIIVALLFPVFSYALASEETINIRVNRTEVIARLDTEPDFYVFSDRGCFESDKHIWGCFEPGKSYEIVTKNWYILKINKQLEAEAE